MIQSRLTHKTCNHGHMIRITQYKEKRKKTKINF
jgi:hypothetical protein